MTDAARHPLFARLYARMTEREHPLQAEHRRELLSGLTGRVLELGAGNGKNFALYPTSVTDVVALEPEPYLRGRALRAAGAAPVPVRVIDAVADSVPYLDGTFDAAVVSLVLCTVPDQARALGELRRVIRPGGELRFYEHVHANRQPLRAFLELADRSTIWPLVAGGCHPTRETLEAIAAAGFDVERSRRFGFAPVRFEPRVPHVLGLARRP